MSAPHFDPATYDAQLAEKTARLRALLAPFDAPAPDVYDSPREHYRLRAEFRLWREDGQRHYAMFEPGDKHTPILIDEFPIASRRINELMPKLRAAWQTSETLSFKLFQVEFLTTLSGDALITLAYHRPLNDAWQPEAQKLAETLGASIVGRSRGKRIVIGRDYVTEQLTVAGRTFSYRQPEGAFTQPNGEVCQKMLTWAFEVLGERNDDLLELYCGNGNFTLPLATRVPKVLATEISKSSVNAALANLDDNGIDNVCLVRLSAEDPDSLLIEKLTRDRGWKVDPQPAPGHIQAIGALYRIHELSQKVEADPHLIDATLMVITRAWGNDRDAAQAVILEGLARFIAKHGARLDINRLYEVLRARSGGVSQLHTEATQMAKMERSRVTNMVAHLITVTYNKGARGRSVPAWGQRT